MKYYIVGKTSKEGPTHDTSGNLNSYYELGWEVMVTHYRIKKYLYEKKISEQDFIVTTNDDRKFLYETTFKNVIGWDEFLTLDKSNNEVIDLVDLSTKDEFHSELVMYQPEISNQDLNEILFSFKKDEEILLNNFGEKYVCLQYRNRDWCTDRNMDKNFFNSLVKYFTEEKKIKTYIMGIGGEIFCDNVNAIYTNLKQFTTLINNHNCLFFFSGMSGPAHLSYFFGHNNLYHIVNSVGGERQESLRNHPLYMGDIYNHTGVNVKILPHSLSVEKIKEYLTF
jgi:hypothetical protein